MRLGSILFLVILCSTAALAQPLPDTLWTRYYGDESDVEVGGSFAQTADGGYIIVGRQWGYHPNHTYFLKINSSGYVTTERLDTVAALGDAASDVYPLPDGSGYIICGVVTTGSLRFDAYVMKTFQIGTPVWTHTFGDANNDENIFTMCPADDGGFLIAGSTAPHGTYNYSGYLAKVNAAGIFQWSRTYGNIGLGAIGQIRPLGNDTYIVAGGADTSISAGDYDLYAVKLNGLGDTLWTSVFGGPGHDEAKSVVLTNDGGFLFAGATSSSIGTYQIYLVRTDANGDSLWTRSFGDTLNQYSTSAVPGPDGGFVLVGGATSGEMSENLYLVGIDAGGNELWSRVFRNTVNGYTNRVLAASDGGYCVLANVFGPHSNDLYVIKTGPDLGYGAGGPGPVIPQQWALNAYPNPFNSQARITFTLPHSANVGLDLFNIAGQRVTSLTSGNFAPGTHSIDLNGDGLASGVYLVRLDAADVSQSFKLVLMK